MKTRIFCLVLVAGLFGLTWQFKRATAEVVTEPDTSQEAQQMAKAAEQCYHANVAAYEAHTVPLSEVFAWSRRWVQSQVRIAKTNDERRAAYHEHRERITLIYEKISARDKASHGAEAENYFASKYFLFEADMWMKIANAGGKPKSDE